jgi:plastocyanin domain-containing protein
MRFPIVILALVSVLVGAGAPAGTRPAAKREQRVVITVTKNGFEPALVRVKAGQPVRLVVTRTVERTCATDIVIKDYRVNRPLPLNRPVEVRLTPRKPGAIHYACAMDMFTGTLLAE